MAQPRDFGFGMEEQMLRESARKFIRDNCGAETLRRLIASDHEAAYESSVQPACYDRSLWTRTVDLGLASLAVPEHAGGGGGKMVAVAALAEEVGYAALPSPLIATLTASRVLRAADEKYPAGAAARWMEKISKGAAATLATTNRDGSWEPHDSSVELSACAGGALLNGCAYFVQDARKAEFLVVSAACREGIGLYAVAVDAPGVIVRPDCIVDLTRDQASVEFHEVELDDSALLAPPGLGADALGAAIPCLLTVVAADSCGAAEWQLQTTADYARVRSQFDRPIGSFQAVKHPIVNMMVDIDRARSLVYAAACAIDSDPSSALRLSRMAKAAASDAAAFCSSRSVQLHGGIGFTWDCTVHIYFKRQKHNQYLYGDAPYQRAKLAEMMDAEAA